MHEQQRGRHQPEVQQRERLEAPRVPPMAGPAAHHRTLTIGVSYARTRVPATGGNRWKKRITGPTTLTHRWRVTGSTTPRAPRLVRSRTPSTTLRATS